MLISSFQQDPTARFEGYCFVGPDYVAGADGASVYEAAHGKALKPGEDGCYTIATRTPAGWEFGTDSHGMAKLFIYQKADTWAVGSSLYTLARHLRSHGVTLNPSIPNLHALGIRNTLMHQVNTRHTLIEDITLVPTYQGVRVTPSGPATFTLPKVPEVEYAAALSDYISTWRSRLMTILEDPDCTVAADLSGGMDSRVVFAFLVAAGAAEIGPERFRLVSNRSKMDDFRPASAIVETYGIALNGPDLERRTEINHRAALESWKETCLGVYLPLYFVGYDLDPRAFQAHGAGGGNYRPVELSGRRALDAARFESSFPTVDFAAWQAQIEADSLQFSQVAPDVPNDVMHYRQFRGRMHFGHRPHRRAMFTPLNSAGLDKVYDRPGMSDDRQVYYDIMESLAPGLMSMPYDNPDKGPGAGNIAAVTRADLDSTISAGKIFAGSAPAAMARDAGPTALSMWVDEAENALHNPDVVALMSESGTARARAALDEHRTTKRLSGAKHPGVLELAFAVSASFAMTG